MNGPLPDMNTGTRIHIAHGQVTGHQGTRFAGITCVPATGSKPARVHIAIRHGARELTAELHAGDTVHLADHTWRLDAIHVSRPWHATLTRVG